MTIVVIICMKVHLCMLMIVTLVYFLVRRDGPGRPLPLQAWPRPLQRVGGALQLWLLLFLLPHQ